MLPVSGCSWRIWGLTDGGSCSLFGQAQLESLTFEKKAWLLVYLCACLALFHCSSLETTISWTRLSARNTSLNLKQFSNAFASPKCFPFFQTGQCQSSRIFVAKIFKPLQLYATTMRQQTNSAGVFPFLTKYGFTHAAKMAPVKSYNDFSRPFVEKRVVRLNRNLLCSGWTHFYQNEVTYERLCDCSLAEGHFLCDVQLTSRCRQNEARFSMPRSQSMSQVWFLARLFEVEFNGQVLWLKVWATSWSDVLLVRILRNKTYMSTCKVPDTSSKIYCRVDSRRSLPGAVYISHKILNHQFLQLPVVCNGIFGVRCGVHLGCDRTRMLFFTGHLHFDAEFTVADKCCWWAPQVQWCSASRFWSSRSSCRQGGWSAKSINLVLGCVYGWGSWEKLPDKTTTVCGTIGHGVRERLGNPKGSKCSKHRRRNWGE